MKMFLLLATLAFAGVCPQGQKAVGDDSEQGYKCVAREEGESRPSLKPSSFKAGNSVSATGDAAVDKQGDKKADAGEAAKAVDENPLGSRLRPIKKKANRGDAGAATGGCPKGWKKKGDGCAPPATKKQPD